MKSGGWGGIVTLICVTFAAYLVADIAHEGLGHGGMCLALGGRPLFLSTTFEDCSIHARLIDGAGPGIGILVALLAAAWLWLFPPRENAGRIFLLLVFAFAGFWNVFYLIRSGLTDQGDWAFVIAGLEPKFAWHAAMTALGALLYVLAMAATATLIRTRVDTPSAGLPVFTFTLIAFGAAILLAEFAALFDRRAVAPDFIDTLPSALAAFGLVLVGRSMARGKSGFRVAVSPSPAWIAAGLASAVFFVAVLGPGLLF